MSLHVLNERPNQGQGKSESTVTLYTRRREPRQGFNTAVGPTRAS